MNAFHTLMDYLQDPFLAGMIGKALLVGIPISLCASLLGVTLVLKRYSMIGDGLSHVGFGALAIATLLNMGGGTDRTSTLLISLPLVLVAAFLLLRMSQSAHTQGDAAIALVSTGAIAIGYMIFTVSGTGSPADVCTSLFGRSTVLSLSDTLVALSFGLSVAVLTLYLLCYSQIFSLTLDETFEEATGVKTKRYQTLIALLTAVTIVLGMQLVGAVMISGLIVFPTLTSMRLFKSFRGVVISTAILSVSCYVLGFLFATVYDLPTGPAVICVNLVLYLTFSLLAKVRRRA